MPELSLQPSDPVPPRLAGSRPVVIYRIGQLGDTLLSLPAIDAVRRQNPGKRLVLLTDRHPEQKGFVSSWDIIGPTGLCDGVIFYDASDQALRKWRTYLKLVQKIRSIAPSEVINLAPRVRFSDIRRDEYFFRVLCAVPAYRALPADDEPKSSSIRGGVQGEPEWKRLARAVGAGADSSQFELRIPRWASQEAQSALSALPKNARRLVALGPGSKMPAKRWPAERFAEVGRRILEVDDGTAIVILGGPEDQELGDKLQAGWGVRCVNLAGRVSVFGSAATLSRTVGYIGNDSGAMHLAGIIGVPCVALFSARDIPGKWIPLGTGHRILQKTVDCAGCMLEVCNRNNLCLTEIGVDEVVTAWESVSAAKTPGAHPLASTA